MHALWLLRGMRRRAQVSGFKYTDANKNSGVTWDNESMFNYLQNPKKYIKGTNMAFPGFKKEQVRAPFFCVCCTLLWRRNTGLTAAWHPLGRIAPTSSRTSTRASEPCRRCDRGL